MQKAKEENVKEQVNNIQTYNEYADIVQTYEDIAKKRIVDPSLIFEWNTWRAFIMLDDGEILGNFKVDLQGMPLINAPGNKPDIVCEYKNYNIIVEVTIASGQKQYEMEGESVARHLGLHQKEKNKETYCIFITPSLSGATLAHFYTLHKTNISFYGGKSKIVPMEVKDFNKILFSAFKAGNKPSSSDIYNFVSEATKSVHTTKDEIEWYGEITKLANNWLNS